MTQIEAQVQREVAARESASSPVDEPHLPMLLCLNTPGPNRSRAPE